MIRACESCQVEFEARTNAKRCPDCRRSTELQTMWSKKWRDENREAFRASRRDWWQRIDEETRERYRVYKRESYSKHREAVRAQHKDAYQHLRNATLAAYGGHCACCGETTPEFLAIDHIEGGGREHRRRTGNGRAFHRWLEKLGYPEGFQILCHNCNMAKGFYGECPHQRQPDQSLSSS